MTMWIAAVLSFAAVASGFAAEEGGHEGHDLMVDPQQQIDLLLKVLVHEKGIASGPKEKPVEIGVLLPSGEHEGAWPESQRFMKQLSAEMNVGGRGIILSGHRYRGDDEAIEWMRNGRLDAVVISFCPEERLEQILLRLEEIRIITFLASREHVHPHVMVSLLVKDGKPTLYVDRALAKRRGFGFSSNLLKLAKSIE